MNNSQKTWALCGGAMLALFLVFALVDSFRGSAADAGLKKNSEPVKSEEQKAAEKKVADEATEATKKKQRVVTLLEGELARFRKKLGYDVWEKDDSYKELTLEEKDFDLRQWIGSLVRYERDYFIPNEAKVASLTRAYETLWAQRRVRQLALVPIPKKDGKVHKEAGFDKLSHEAKIARLEEAIENLSEEALIARNKVIEDAETAKKLPEYSSQEIADLKKMRGGYKMYYASLELAKINLDSKIAQIEKKYGGDKENNEVYQKDTQGKLDAAKLKKNNKEGVASLERSIARAKTDLVNLTSERDRNVALEARKKQINALEIERAKKSADFLRAEIGK